MSPTQRSLAHLKALGYTAKVVERWNPFAKIRQDLFGVDILALKAGAPLLAVQCTSGSNVAARIEKLRVAGFIELWRSVGAVIEVWGWAKQGPRGQRKSGRCGGSHCDKNFGLNSQNDSRGYVLSDFHPDHTLQQKKVA